MANLVVGELATLHREVKIPTYLADADEHLAFLVLGVDGGSSDFHGISAAVSTVPSLSTLFEQTKHREYPPEYPISMDTIQFRYHTDSYQKRRSARTHGRLVNHLFD